MTVRTYRAQYQRHRESMAISLPQGPSSQPPNESTVWELHYNLGSIAKAQMNASLFSFLPHLDFIKLHINAERGSRRARHPRVRRLGPLPCQCEVSPLWYANLRCGSFHRRLLSEPRARLFHYCFGVLPLTSRYYVYNVGSDTTYPTVLTFAMV
ncbi:hypothetical protein BS47DRAFT_1343092 [Hydnum rufescens UP504]|uniref:Uncharacterized protein n=1 Tax=Hydnum rufescens UP504 TaxID=1448309 RepID=A0A9P6AYT7_9AGAM|nr:hypothetical protein BS47DRAFT_1343092 [Hydnum rufescens UP504]